MTEKELTSVSKAHINTLLASLNFHFERIGQTTTTVCYAFLPNGFRVGHGDSACVNPANYDYAEGCKWAKENAIKSATQNLWMMEGYLLKVTGQTSDRLTIDAASTTPVDSDVLEGFKVYQGKAIKRTAYELQLQYELDGERITAQTFTTTGHYELVILRPCYLVPNNAKFSVV
ncbi:hypothetical protein EDL57_13435 [Vibrio cholerae]|nr:hypothetical protein [Vibrio cholerae]EGR2122138.1 hypothetical protein [Vibrio cholerae]